MPDKTKLLWPVILLLGALTLAACVRPYPQPETAAQPIDQNELLPTTAPVLPPVQPEVVPEITQEPLPTPENVEQPTPEVEPTAEPVADSVHTVQAGETLFIIASQYGSSVEAIAAANDLEDINRLEVGQELIIPAPGTELDENSEPDVEAEPTSESEPAEVEQPTPVQENPGTHVVTAGDNLYRIGLTYGCTVEQMARANNIVDPTRLHIGQSLTIPDCS